MATQRFYPQSKNGECKIYIRLTLKRGKDFRLSTKQTIKDASTWNYGTNLPKKTTENNKRLFSTLKELENHIEDEIFKIEKSKEKSINDLSSKWLKSVILDFYNETPTEDKELLIPYAKAHAECLLTKTYLRNGIKIPYSIKTIDKFRNIAKQLELYQNHINRKIKISDVDVDFAEAFLGFLTTEFNRAVNTKGVYVKRLKNIVKNAELDGKKVNIKYKGIQGFEDETIVTFLTFEEIDKIIETKMPNEKLQIAKEWLIIGCYTSQRISDLYRMKKQMISNEDNFRYISFKQFKTKKWVKVPIHYKIENILQKYNSNFPPNLNEDEKSNRTNLSKQMKEVCKLAGIKEIVRGRYNGVIGHYPKHELIQNHSCRRSFCSNFYNLGWEIQMIMEISGHETEKSFYKYIDKSNFYLSKQVANKFAQMKADDLNKKANLKIAL